MPAPQRPHGPRPARTHRRVRTNGAPRLVPPGGPGNRSPYWAVHWQERDANGKSRSRRWSTGASDQTLAREQFIRWQAARSRTPNTVTIEKIVAAYLEAVKATVRHHGKIASLLRRPRAEFGPLHPDDLSPDMVRQYTARRLKEPRMRAAGRKGEGLVERGGTVSKRTVTDELVYLATALNWAKAERWIKDVPTIKTPGGIKSRKRRLSQAEARRLYEAITDDRTPPHVRAMVTLGLLTGQRAGHIKALRWSDVDFEGGMIWFSRSNADAAENKRVADVPMAPTLARLLSVMKKAARTEYVIEYQDAPVGEIKTAWRSLLKRAKLDDFRFHDLRRSAASFALNAGVPLTQVAALIADDERTAARHYAHANPQLLTSAVEMIATALDGNRPVVQAPFESVRSALGTSKLRLRLGRRHPLPT